MSTLVTALLFACCVDNQAAWVPPANPLPRLVLKEARADAREGRHEIALAKHLWYHRHATEHDELAKHSRLLSALHAWVELGKVYPPAREKLNEVRDAVIGRVKMGQDVQQSFRDFEAINRSLRQDQRTKDAFLWLHGQNKEAAKEVFDIAGRALIETGEHKLYGEYVRPSRRRNHIPYFHRTQMRIVEQDAKHAKGRRLAAEHILIRDASMLVACLVIARREAEAKKTAELLKELCDSPKYYESLERGLQGVVPGPLVAPTKQND